MPHHCAAHKCTRASRGLCDCCQQNLCLQHLNEHNASLISQLNPLTDEINALGDRLKSVNVQHIIDKCRLKLQQWREESHEKIDRLYIQKCQEFDQLVNEKTSEQHEKLIAIQSKMTELISAQETTRQDIDQLTLTIQQLNKDIDRIEQTHLMIISRPCLLNNTLAFTLDAIENEIDLDNLAPVWKTIDRPDGSYASLASNDRYLLIHQQPNLSILDQDMNIVKQIPWSHDAIYDMCWSTTLRRFIVIGGKLILTVNESTLSVDNVKLSKERYWQSCTCSDTSLFLSTNEYTSSIVEFRLLPSIKFIKEWKYPVTCAQNEVISGIVYNDSKLALMIMNEAKKSLRIVLCDVKTLNCIWSRQLDIVCTQSIAFRCCALTCHEWLVSDFETRRLLHITQDGQVKKIVPYSAIPYRANLFGDMLAVSRNDGVNLHKL
ncbi:unnamed protein product [Adineta ricciae]|uniref:Uncharacterized protein n=1 Tax=Adineta ricciae TaxID=249248 RepID=A0A815HRW1_ADIRI|nr:unnamed protein product [Adineta ricciae]CAF1653739.1 unnamed protein product [Adineta ricciae]